MSHKNKKLTWYQLYLRIAKMKLCVTKTDPVMIKIDDKMKPVSLEFDNNGETAYLVLQDPDAT